MKLTYCGYASIGLKEFLIVGRRSVHWFLMLGAEFSLLCEGQMILMAACSMRSR